MLPLLAEPLQLVLNDDAADVISPRPRPSAEAVSASTRAREGRARVPAAYAPYLIV